MIFSIRRDWPALLILVGMILGAVSTWGIAPDRLPVHWGISGEPDRWGGKAEGLLLMPGVAALVFVLMAVLPRFDPGRANYASFAGAYTLLRTAIVGFFALMYAATILPLHGIALEMSSVVSLATGALFIVIGGMMGRLRPNWFTGIRTPWTLSSKRSWVKTHRVGGWAFIGVGVAVLVAGMLSSSAAYVVMMIGALGVTAFTVVYSWMVWRSDPDKIPPAGTTPANGPDP